MYGLAGAAIATAISKLIYSSLRITFLKVRFKLQPFNYKFLFLIGIGFTAYYAGYLLPQFENYLIDIFVRSSIVLIVFSTLILVLNISEDINNLYSSMIRRFKL